MGLKGGFRKLIQTLSRNRSPSPIQQDTWAESVTDQAPYSEAAFPAVVVEPGEEQGDDRSNPKHASAAQGEVCAAVKRMLLLPRASCRAHQRARQHSPPPRHPHCASSSQW